MTNQIVNEMYDYSEPLTEAVKIICLIFRLAVRNNFFFQTDEGRGTLKTRRHTREGSSDTAGVKTGVR